MLLGKGSEVAIHESLEMTCVPNVWCNNFIVCIVTWKVAPYCWNYIEHGLYLARRKSTKTVSIKFTYHSVSILSSKKKGPTSLHAAAPVHTVTCGLCNGFLWIMCGLSSDRAQYDNFIYLKHLLDVRQNFESVFDFLYIPPSPQHSVLTH